MIKCYRKNLLGFLFIILVAISASGCAVTIRQVKTIPVTESTTTTMVIRTIITNAKNTDILRYKIRIPVNVNYRQKIKAVRFNPEPDSITDDGTERFAEYLLVNPKDITMLKMEFDLEIYRYDVHIASNFDIDSEDELNPSKFIRDEDKIESDDPEILKIASEINGKDRYEIVEKIYLKVIEKLEYDQSIGHKKSWKGAKKSLDMGTGVCSDYTDLFVALCRAKNIPARYVSGYSVSEYESDMGHAWAEVYFKDKGWIRFDTTWGDDILTDTDFFHNTPRYVILMRSSRDHSTRYSYRGDPPTISSKVKFTNIKEHNTFNGKASSLDLNDLLKDNLFKDMLDRNKNIYTRYAEAKKFNKKNTEKLVNTTALVFKTEHLDKDEKEILKKFITDTPEKIKKKKKTYRQIYKRYMWLAKYRIMLEENKTKGGKK